VRLKEELNSEAGVESRVRLGGFRELTVIVDGETVFSNRKLKRKPLPGEIAEIIRGRQHKQRTSDKENG
jgi:hypothetical protein